MREPSPASERFAAIAKHPKLEELTRLTAKVLLGAAAERRSWDPATVQSVAEQEGLSGEEADTPAGNAVEALAAPDQASGSARRLLGWLLARALGREPHESPEEQRALATKLAWLSAHSPVDGLGALESCELPAAESVWRELAYAVLAVDRGELGAGHRPMLLAALPAIACARDGQAALALLRDGLDDPRYQALLGAPGAHADGGRAPGDAEGTAEPVAGELVAAPLRPWLLVLGAATGVLIVWWILRILGRAALRIRRPAELSVSERIVTVRSRLEVMTRTIRTAEIHIPVENLACAIREVRYPRIAMYAGLLCLAVGSYIGVSLWVDGARAASPSLLGFGAIVFGVGVAVDLLGSTLLPGRAGRTRLLLVPRKGRRIALRTADGARASDALRRLATRA
jgi:hypothetical protein